MSLPPLLSYESPTIAAQLSVTGQPFDLLLCCCFSSRAGAAHWFERCHQGQIVRHWRIMPLVAGSAPGLASCSRQSCWEHTAMPKRPRTVCGVASMVDPSRTRRRHAQPVQPDVAYDVVLSSGFLAFANHSGFLTAVEEAGFHVSGIMGTSAGALAGSLYAAGYTPRQVAQELSRVPPIELLQPCFEPWRGGVLSLDGVVDRLRELLPPTFEDLQHEFAVGVVNAAGEHVLIDSGPLAEAVAASAAIPVIFANVPVPQGPGGEPYKDGGVVDRVGLKAWRTRRRAQQRASCSSLSPSLPPCLVHVIERSSPFSGADDCAVGEKDVHVVRSPRSGANFLDLGEFTEQFNTARRRAQPVLERARLAKGHGRTLGGQFTEMSAAAP